MDISNVVPPRYQLVSWNNRDMPLNFVKGENYIDMLDPKHDIDHTPHSVIRIAFHVRSIIVLVGQTILCCDIFQSNISLGDDKIRHFVLKTAAYVAASVLMMLMMLLLIIIMTIMMMMMKMMIIRFRTWFISNLQQDDNE